MRSIQSKTFLKDQVIEYFSQLPDARKILIGFSGGPDSMCLMLLLDELKAQLGIEIVLAYYNHMLRSQDELSAELRNDKIQGIRLRDRDICLGRKFENGYNST